MKRLLSANRRVERMKKIILTLLFLLAFIGVACADDWQLSSGEQTADAAIYSGRGFFYQILVVPDGTNDVTVSIYDNTSASGTKIRSTMTFAGDGGAKATPLAKIRVVNGIYVDVTTDGTVAYDVLYRER